MTSGEDYGSASAESTLVPGSLIAYRHFALVPQNQTLAPMADPEVSVYDVRYRHEGRFRADCFRLRPPPSWRVFPSLMGGSHKSPVIDCTCGFYAHYSSKTDFYVGCSWTPATEDELFSSSYLPSWQPRTGLYGYSSARGFAILRAVVELSGRIVMGRRGVRAERLKVRALAVDWAKVDHTATEQRVELDPPGFPFHLGRRDLNYDASMRIVTGPKQEIQAQYELYARKAADLYEAEHFLDPKVMYEKYPEPDLEALGIKKERPAEPSLRWQLGQVSVAAQAAAAGFNKLTAAHTAPEAADDTPMARAIEAKKQRPAPPGTGIDRRRRKL
ncbi:hypothetical protein [Streptomyces roseolus]|uniref:hypothetical protein n=1 Tax=Streptomyces roseolus TaxID=67358 RepID=UPI00167BEEBC|nr:hypothetical protein [Streptomyces roseolus]GGR51513.1 hypothetical protein GCM10010282_50530 [Streptomyces roseolus]